MTTNSVTSSIVSSLGGGSGIDMTALAGSLATAQFANRIDRTTTRADTLDRQISAASTLKSQLLQLSGSIGDRVRTGDLSAQPAIGNSAVASVSRGVGAGSGSYTLEVSALAAPQTLSSPAYAAPTTAVGSGTLTLRFGTIAGTTFAADTARQAVDVTIPSGSTLADAARAINAAKAGVSAYVATGANGAQLMLKGAEGETNAFVVEANETPGDEGLAKLAWQPAGDASRRLSNAANASFKLDGLALSSASNALENVVPGLNLVLNGTNVGAPTKITFSDPSAAVTTFMQDLTSALNELVTTLSADIDPMTGELARDNGARALRRELTQLAGTVVMPSAGTSEARTLADLGLATERNGTFRLDTTRLSATLKSSPASVTAMFSNGVSGVYATIDRLSRTVTSASDPGSLSGSIARMTKQKSALTSELSALADKQEKVRQQLITRFAGVDTRVAASKSTLSFLQSQFSVTRGTSGN